MWCTGTVTEGWKFTPAKFVYCSIYKEGGSFYCHCIPHKFSVGSHLESFNILNDMNSSLCSTHMQDCRAWALSPLSIASTNNFTTNTTTPKNFQQHREEPRLSWTSHVSPGFVTTTNSCSEFSICWTFFLENIKEQSKIILGTAIIICQDCLDMCTCQYSPTSVISPSQLSWHYCDTLWRYLALSYRDCIFAEPVIIWLHLDLHFSTDLRWALIFSLISGRTTAGSLVSYDMFQLTIQRMIPWWLVIAEKSTLHTNCLQLIIKHCTIKCQHTSIPIMVISWDGWTKAGGWGCESQSESLSDYWTLIWQIFAWGLNSQCFWLHTITAFIWNWLNVIGFCAEFCFMTMTMVLLWSDIQFLFAWRW